MKKSIHHLTLDNFDVNPIWQPLDDLEDPDMEVIPFQGENFHIEEMYLVAAKFILADGSEWEGYIRYSGGEPIVMALAISNMEFLLFGAQRLDETEENHIEFARALNRQYDDVFPIEYQTKVKPYFQGSVY